MNEELSERLLGLREEHLTDSERSVLRDQTVQFMEAHPLRSPTITTSFRAFARTRRRAIPFAIGTLLFGLSGGMAFAAEGSLPGDMLYPIKIHVNEEVRSVLAVTPKAKAEFARDAIERRVHEAEVLQTEDRFDDERKSELEKHTANHLELLTVAEERMREEGNTRGADESDHALRESLHEHEATLRVLGVSLDRRNRGREDTLTSDDSSGRAPKNRNNNSENERKGEGDDDASHGGTSVDAPPLNGGSGSEDHRDGNEPSSGNGVRSEEKGNDRKQREDRQSGDMRGGSGSASSTMSSSSHEITEDLPNNHNDESAKDQPDSTGSGESQSAEDQQGNSEGSREGDNDSSGKGNEGSN